MRTLINLTATLLIVAGSAGTALAAGSSSTTDTNTYSSDATTQAFRDGEAAVEAQNWQQAIIHFQQAVDLDPGDADAFNMLAYSQRQNGDLANAFANYDKALAIDPDHEEAREYLGEAYLQAGDLDSAMEQLETLNSICWLGCQSYDELESAIATYKADNS
ncbi:MAG: tetratricopeptide repeat protein [Alphaproteobacteria bacterium]|jgi:Flp pilus assembly protein TadD